MNQNQSQNQDKSLWALSMPFLFLALANNVVPIINTLALALVPNDGVIYSESVGVANTVFSIFSVLTTFAIGGVGVIVGQCIGRKVTQDLMRQVICTCLTIAFIFCVGIFAIGEIFSPFILLGFLKNGTQQYTNAVTYIETMHILIILWTMKNAMCAVMNNHGFVKYTIGINLLSIFLDTGLTFAFVLGAKIGIVGSSLGSILAAVIALTVTIVFFSKLIIKIKPKDIRINKEFAKKLLKISLPIGGEKLSYNFAMFLVGLLVAQIGDKFAKEFIIVDGTSRINLLNLSYTIIQTFGNIVTICSVAFSQGAAIICSWKMGAKEYDATKVIIRNAFIVSIIADVILAITLFFLRDYVLMFFQITNPIVKDYFSEIKGIIFVPFLLLIFLQMGRTINIIYLTGPMSYGNLVANVIFSVINTWIIVLGLGAIVYFLSSNNSHAILYGINGIYIMLALDEIVRGIFNLTWWKCDKWSGVHSLFMVKNIGGKKRVKTKYSKR